MLKGNLLFYKERPTDRDLTGVIVLEGCTVQLCESEEQFAFSLVWSEPGLRTYKFAAEDQDSQESWIKALLSANHSYLALLVMDLEKKYRGERLEGWGCLFICGWKRAAFVLESSCVNHCLQTPCTSWYIVCRLYDLITSLRHIHVNTKSQVCNNLNMQTFSKRG